MQSAAIARWRSRGNIVSLISIQLSRAEGGWREKEGMEKENKRLVTYN
jgi:hypothetical protein